MSNKPPIYGFCPAGSRWETVHKNDFMNSASVVRLPKVEDVTYIVDADYDPKVEYTEQPEYKIKDETNATASTGNVWGFKLKYKFKYGGVTSSGEALTLPGRTRYANGLSFKIVDVSPVGTNGGVLTYEINGVRKTESMIPQSAATSDSYHLWIYAEPTLAGAGMISAYRINTDAEILLDAGQWYTGTAVTGTGTSISATIEGSKAGDMYLNTETYRVYRATNVNVWDYACDISSGVSNTNYFSEETIINNTNSTFTYADGILSQDTWDSTYAREAIVFNTIDMSFVNKLEYGTPTASGTGLYIVFGKIDDNTFVAVRANYLSGTEQKTIAIEKFTTAGRVGSTITQTATSTESKLAAGDTARAYIEGGVFHLLRNGAEIMSLELSKYGVTTPCLGFMENYGLGSATSRLIASNLGYTRSKMVDIIVFAGQSNMAGRGQGVNAPTVPLEAGAEFRAISAPNALYEINEATQPFGYLENNASGLNDVNGEDVPKKTGSLVPAFINAYYARTGVPVIGVSASEGSTTTSGWTTASRGYYQDAIARYNKAKNWLLANNYTIRRKLFVWLQGESDASYAVTASTYKANMDNLFNTLIRGNTDLEKCLIIRIGHHLENYSGKSYDYIMLAQNDLFADYDNFIMCSTKLGECAGSEYYNVGDYTHFNQTALNAVGKDAGTRAGDFAERMTTPILYDNLTDGLIYAKRSEVI